MFYFALFSQTAFEIKSREFEFQTDQNAEALSFVKGHFALSAQLRAEGVFFDCRVCVRVKYQVGVIGVFSRFLWAVFSMFQVFFGNI